MATKKRAFTLIELLAAIGILSALVLLILPAVQSARESSRRLACGNHLKQIGLAIHNYSASHGYFPPINSQTRFFPEYDTRSISAHSFSVLARTLPYLEQSSLYDAVNFGPIPTFATGLNDNLTVMETRLDHFLCPSDPQPPVAGYGRVNYRFSVGPTVYSTPYHKVPNSFQGPFTVHAAYRPADFLDGLSNTVCASERLQGDWSAGPHKPGGDYRLTQTVMGEGEPSYDQIRLDCEAGPTDGQVESRGGESWFLSGFHFTTYNHVTPPNSMIPSCSFDEQTEDLHARSLHHGNFPATSYHPGGVNVLAMDGSVHFVRDAIDLELWKAASTRFGRSRAESIW